MLDEERNQQDFAINEEIIEDHTDLMQVFIFSFCVDFLSKTLLRPPIRSILGPRLRHTHIT